ncbi:MAG: hypothetical protein A2583_10710 [Bdellovibrionales bacterium RIFOXYD1_FULL_53_11]|nr:MAG: hypothetical protein A2583_10710 [Bdellovibrionales bacterium RIFOXYD1_FULL_53_11]
MLARYSPSVLVFWRWLFASGFLCAAVLAEGTPIDWQTVLSPRALASFFLLATVAGVAAMAIYYTGLRRMPAHIVTFIELLYPLFAVFFNFIFWSITPSTMQLAGGFILALAIALLVMVYYKFDSSQQESSQS